MTRFTSKRHMCQCQVQTGLYRMFQTQVVIVYYFSNYRRASYVILTVIMQLLCPLYLQRIYRIVPVFFA